VLCRSSWSQVARKTEQITLNCLETKCTMRPRTYCTLSKFHSRCTQLNFEWSKTDICRTLQKFAAKGRHRHPSPESLRCQFDAHCSSLSSTSNMMTASVFSCCTHTALLSGLQNSALVASASSTDTITTASMATHKNVKRSTFHNKYDFSLFQ
jgi:hypothetical protein